MSIRKSLSTLIIIATLLMAFVIPQIAQAAPVPAPTPPTINFVQLVSKTVNLGGQWNAARPPFNWMSVVKLLWPNTKGVGVPYKYYDLAGNFKGWFVRVQVLESVSKAIGALPPLGPWYCSYTDPYGNRPAGCSGSVTNPNY